MTQLQRQAFWLPAALSILTLNPLEARGNSGRQLGVVDFVVQSGGSERIETPISVAIDPALAVGLRDGSAIVKLQEVSEQGDRIGEPFDGQLDPGENGTNPRLTFLLHGKTPKGTQRGFRFEPAKVEHGPSPWTLNDRSSGALELRLKNGDRPVFRYNLAPVSSAKHAELSPRDAYLHPAYTPSGAVITGDYSTSHPHHRGFFLAYTKTAVGDLHPDFWNYQNGTGKIRFDKLESAVAGPVTARIVAKHVWGATGGGDVLDEGWEITAYDVPGTPYWMFDLTSTQRAIDKPMELVPYRYGGMAYRGPEPFYHGKIDVLTSAGLDRVKGDQKPARWVDLTGPLAEGSSRFGGAVILDHPSNPNHPTVARIHPTTIPFFVYTPGHDRKLTIVKDVSTVFRYRIVIHDGHPDPVLNDRLWRDFAEPPVVTVAPNAP